MGVCLWHDSDYAGHGSQQLYEFDEFDEFDDLNGFGIANLTDLTI